jgi:DNA-binding MarR family transcriptional regulator
MADREESGDAPPVGLYPGDAHILRFLARRGPTYHINISKALPWDIGHVSRRCKALARRGILERRSRTYYALTDRGERLVANAAEPDGADAPARAGAESDD